VNDLARYPEELAISRINANDDNTDCYSNNNKSNLNNDSNKQILENNQI